MKFKKYLVNILITVLTAVITVAIYNGISNNNNEKGIKYSKSIESDTNGIHFANLPADFKAENFDFTLAAENSVPAAVHVKSKFVREGSQFDNPLFEYFFGDRYQQPQKREQVGYGSGVIISSDGYIVTNHHVIKESDELEVIMNDEETYEAEIVGTDPATDIALLKVDAKNLPSLKFGSSKDLKLGEWVLAVGNPFNIGTTVTAGIVSAKGRNLGLMNRQENRLAIESFIQTDAAVNKGNSGGALVNVEGELIGINSAIASPTGTYSGYAFAVPSEIARKVVSDIMKYGEVQRAVLGVTIRNVTSELKKEYELDVEDYKGVYIAGVTRDGAANKAGIKPGDVILKVEGEKVKDVAALQSEINNYRPGDEISVTVKRDGKKKQFDVTLRNRQGSTDIITGTQVLKELGAEFEKLKDSEKDRLGINHGVKVVRLKDGTFKEAGIKEGFVITFIEGKKIRSAKDVKEIFSQASEGARVEVEGLYPGGNMIYVYQVKPN
ncbi:MAG: Do family serine endopeptidase [Bacteroidota bacterium]